MTEAPSAPGFGQTLPDQFDRISEYFDAGLAAVDDVREIYTARAALEREYAGKLQALARKAAERKAKSCTALVLGPDPTKSWDDDTLRQSSLERAYEGFVDSMANAAQEHINYADKMTSETIDVLKTLIRRSEEAKRKEVVFFQKLLSDRDRVFSDRIKAKQKYDDQCQEVETFRQKQSRASDDRHADRAAKQAEQQRNDMLDSKNAYLIATAIANRTKARFYDDDIPNLENELQGLHGRLLERFSMVLIRAHEIQLNHLEASQGHVKAVQSKFEDVNVPKDQNLFADYNLRAFTAPGDWKFEPSPVHYDTASRPRYFGSVQRGLIKVHTYIQDEMSVEPAPKIVMQNKRC